MGTEVLRAQDLLQRMRVIGHGAPVLSPIRRHRSNYQNPNPRKHEPQQQHKKRENVKKSSSFVDDCVVTKKNSLVMGGFTLLKRGEFIDESVKKKIDESLLVEPKEKIESVVVDTKPKKKKNKNNGNNSVLTVFGGTKRLGPDPEMVPKQLKVSDLISSSPLLFSNRVSNETGPMYAGSGFVQSPEPDSLPLPSFSLPSFNVRKKNEFVVIVDDTVSVSATKDIRRMLGLVDTARSV